MASSLRVRTALEAIDDIVPPHLALPTVGLNLASPAHRMRFSDYRRALIEVRRVAADWWEGLVDTESRRTGDRGEALRNVRIRRPHGAVVHPRVVQCIRAAWLDCQAINDRSPVESLIAPQALVLIWLIESGDDELAEFVAGLPFWPLGLDGSQRWV